MATAGRWQREILVTGGKTRQRAPIPIPTRLQCAVGRNGGKDNNITTRQNSLQIPFAWTCHHRKLATDKSPLTKQLQCRESQAHALPARSWQEHGPRMAQRTLVCAAENRGSKNMEAKLEWPLTTTPVKRFSKPHICAVPQTRWSHQSAAGLASLPLAALTPQGQARAGILDLTIQAPISSAQRCRASSNRNQLQQEWFCH